MLDGLDDAGPAAVRGAESGEQSPSRHRRRRFIVPSFSVAVLMLDLSQILAHGGPLLRADVDARAIVLRHQYSPLHDLAVIISSLAAVPTSAATLLLVAAVYGWRVRSRAPVILALASLFLLGAVVGTSKFLLGRERPPHPATELFSGGTSFPSGHTTGMVVTLGTAWVLIGPHLRGRRRSTAAVGAVLAAIGVGASRMYLDQHWFTDILGSWAVGALLICAVGLFANRLTSPSRVIEPSVHGRGRDAAARTADGRPASRTVHLHSQGPRSPRAEPGRCP